MLSHHLSQFQFLGQQLRMQKHKTETGGLSVKRVDSVWTDEHTYSSILRT